MTQRKLRSSVILTSLLIASTSLFVSRVATAQTPTVVLTGTVIDSETGLTLPGAHVFIASSMIGTITNGEGQYELRNVPVGALRLYVSSLGYAPSFKEIFLKTETPRTFDFSLEPTVLELEGVVVEAKGDKKWKKRLEKFTKLFIGETPNAREAVIKNPEVLDFAEKKGVFTAYTEEPLIIENHALGYSIQYFLKDFSADRSRVQYDGEPLFTEMEPADAEQAALWKKNRNSAFIGSFRHFLLALLAHQVDEQGFKVYGRYVSDGPRTALGGGSQFGNRYPIDAYSILKPGDSDAEKILDIEAAAEITFTGEYEDRAYRNWIGAQGIQTGDKFQNSFIRTERGPTVIDYKGDYLDAYGVTFFGYLAFERVADQVPREYRPR